MWDESFVATYTVTLKGDRLATNFAVKNTGGAPFSFTGALHSYWSVSSIDGIEIQGAFEGAKYLDKVAGEEKTCATKALKIGAETDAVNGSGSNRERDGRRGRRPTHSPTLSHRPAPPSSLDCTGVQGRQWRRHDRRRRRRPQVDHLVDGGVVGHGGVEPIRRRGNGVRPLRPRRVTRAVPAHIASSAYRARVLTRGTHPCCRYNGFVCVENAQALEPVEVAAGATWTGEMSVAPSPL